MCRQGRNSWSWETWTEKPGVFRAVLFVPRASLSKQPYPCLVFPPDSLAFLPLPHVFYQKARAREYALSSWFRAACADYAANKSNKQLPVRGVLKVLLSRMDTLSSLLCKALPEVHSSKHVWSLPPSASCNEIWEVCSTLIRDKEEAVKRQKRKIKET